MRTGKETSLPQAERNRPLIPLIVVTELHVASGDNYQINVFGLNLEFR